MAIVFYGDYVGLSLPDEELDQFRSKVELAQKGGGGWVEFNKEDPHWLFITPATPILIKVKEPKAARVVSGRPTSRR